MGQTKKIEMSNGEISGKKICNDLKRVLRRIYIWNHPVQHLKMYRIGKVQAMIVLQHSRPSMTIE